MIVKEIVAHIYTQNKAFFLLKIDNLTEITLFYLSNNTSSGSGNTIYLQMTIFSNRTFTTVLVD